MKVALGGAEVSNLPNSSTLQYDNMMQHRKPLSSMQFSCWELAWHLAVAETRMAHIETEVRTARLSIGKKNGHPSRWKKRRQQASFGGSSFSDDNHTRAGDALQEELEKLFRQMMVLKKSNIDLTTSNLALEECLKAPALEKNVTVQQIVEQRLSHRAAVTDPLYAVGIAIRKRYLENSAYHSRNKELVITGNEAAHNGDALADAILYHRREADYREDVLTYSKIYGLPPLAVWKNRHCKPFLQLVTWYGTVKRWHPNNFTCTQFGKAWPADFFEKYSKANSQVVAADFADGKKVDLIKVLEAKYYMEAKQNRLKHQ